MVWSVVIQVFSALLDLFRIGHSCHQEEDLEILVLHKQLGWSNSGWTRQAFVTGRALDTGRDQREAESSHRAFRPTVKGYDPDCPTGNGVTLTSRVGASERNTARPDGQTNPTYHHAARVPGI
jgi:hypothetical protein